MSRTADTANAYLPMPADIVQVQTETADVDTMRLRLSARDQELRPEPGQFVILSVLGVGECPISVSAVAEDGSWIELSIRCTGRVTRALRQRTSFAAVGLRGPFGHGFDLDALAGRPLVCVAGGIGLAPLRPLIRRVLAAPADFGPLAILYGARTPDDLLYVNEIPTWAGSPAAHVVEIVEADPRGTWRGPVGRVTAVMDGLGPEFKGATAVVCGPGPMLRPVVRALEAQGMDAADIQLAMERRMSCGIGKCGHCYVGEKLVCVDGPVFTAAELRRLGEPL